MNIFNLRKTLRSFSYFDKVTRFRLINSFIVAFGFTMLIPVITVLQGSLMLAWIISLFKIIDMIAIKSNEIFVHTFSISSLFKMTVVLHIFYTLSAGMYYYSPIIMIYVDSTFALIETAIMSAYSIMLNNYITNNYPRSMSRFQIVRNNSWSDGALIGLLISTTTLYLLPLGYTLGIFLIINISFSVWLVKNWNFYENI